MRFPNDTQRLSIVGATGSGKTQAALWHLSTRNFHRMPWVVYNFKTDESIDNAPFFEPIGTDRIPVKPGIYVVHPHPDDTDEVEDQMWAIWERGNVGVYVDEGYMISRNNRAFRALLTQGRSKRIPMIVLSQRPVWMDRFVFSESEFFQIFRLTHKKDMRNVEEFVPHDLSLRLPEYHSYYYDVGLNTVTALRPVPDLAAVYRTFQARLEPLRKAV
jgi:hypothetical protein